MIIRVANKADLSLIESFYKAAYKEKIKFKFPERFKWLYEKAFSEQYNIIIAIDNKCQIVGHSGFLLLNSILFEKEIKIGWSIDTFVLEEFRGKGIGKILQKENQNQNQLFASLWMSEKNRQIKLKLGAVSGPFAHLLIKNIRFENTFTGLVHKHAQSHDNVKNEINVLQYSVEEKPFDSKLNDLWNKVKNNYSFAVERNAEYLNWRYGKQPFTKYFYLVCYDDQNHISGLLIYRIANELNLMTIIITELFSNSNSYKLELALLRFLEQFYNSQELFQIQIATSDKILIKKLYNIGYLLVEKKQLLINSNVIDLSAFGPNTKSMITKGDQDWDQYSFAKFYSSYAVLESLNNYRLWSIRKITAFVLIKVFFAYKRICNILLK